MAVLQAQLINTADPSGGGGIYHFRYGGYDFALASDKILTYLKDNDPGGENVRYWTTTYETYDSSATKQKYYAVIFNPHVNPNDTSTAISDEIRATYLPLTFRDNVNLITYTIEATSPCLIYWPYPVTPEGGTPSKSEDMPLDQEWTIFITTPEDPNVQDSTASIYGVQDSDPEVPSLSLGSADITFDYDATTVQTIPSGGHSFIVACEDSSTTTDITVTGFTIYPSNTTDALDNTLNVYCRLGSVTETLLENQAIYGVPSPLHFTLSKALIFNNKDEAVFYATAKNSLGTTKQSGVAVLSRDDSDFEKPDVYVKNLAVFVNGEKCIVGKDNILYTSDYADSFYWEPSGVEFDKNPTIYLYDDTSVPTSGIDESKVLKSTVLTNNNSTQALGWNIEKKGTVSVFVKYNESKYSAPVLLTNAPADNSVYVIDNGTIGEDVDPTQLLFAGDDFVASTLTHKDGTLFVGNINTKNFYISKELKQRIKKGTECKFELVYVDSDEPTSLDKEYTYNSNLAKSNEQSYFKKGEHYRFGVQLQAETGLWSETILLEEDITNNLGITPLQYNDGLAQKPILKMTMNSSIVKELTDLGFIAARPLCVYPDINSRKILCQGLVCSTLFNMSDRQTNAPYAISDWFARPQYTYEPKDWNNAESIDLQHKGAHLTSKMFNTLVNPTTPEKDINYPQFLVGATSESGEIQCMRNPFSAGSTIKDEEKRTLTKVFGIDKRILTIHSPELDTSYSEELQTIALDASVKFRIVGFAPIKHTLSDISIQVESSLSPYAATHSTYVEDFANSTGHIVSSKCMINWPFWVDARYKTLEEDSHIAEAAAFVVYPWQRSGSLNNCPKIEKAENRKSVLTKKILSNYRICLPTRYVTDVELDLEDIQLFNSNETSSFVRLNAWGRKIQYMGNCDKILAFKSTKNSDTTGYVYRDEEGITITRNSITGKEGEILSNNTDISKLQTRENETLTNKYIYPQGWYSNRGKWGTMDEVPIYNNDAISIKYKSSSHAVIALSDKDGAYQLLPSIQKYSGNPYDSVTLTKDKAFWFNDADTKYDIYKFNQPVIATVDNTIKESEMVFPGTFGYYMIGELYRDNVVNAFGDDPTNNIWKICGESSVLKENSACILKATQGDTWFARYDHLKTYSATTEDVNQVIDIPSFMIETKINIDGRYDRNRGNRSNLAMSPQNFNLYNSVYNQSNNYYTATYLDEDKSSNTVFPSQVAWSLTKTLGEESDSWTNVNLVNALDLDGDKGPLNALIRLDDSIYSFQDNGIAKINFNSRVQINTTDGVPIEIANSGKVDGKTYISNSYGCVNKWSIVETPTGIYFIDGYRKALMQYKGDAFMDLSYNKQMYNWTSKHIDITIWNPENFLGVRTLYDPIEMDVYYTTDEEALALNEKATTFSSFYDYNYVSWLFSIKGKSYQIKTDGSGIGDIIWGLHQGNNYNTFFETKKDYKVSVIANSEFTEDKVFDTVEFRTNGTETSNIIGKSSKYPFNTLITENEYQKAQQNSSTMKKKFRTWRWPIGRDSLNKKGGKYATDRIRNPWAKITLLGNYTEEMRLYDLVVTYYV